MDRRRLMIALAAALAMAPVATAQKIPSAEAGKAALSFAAFSAPAPSVTVKPGEVAWREQAHPYHAARLLEEARSRPRPSAEGLPAGSLLFGYQLSTGMAFCPPLDPAKSFKRVQCFRDLDNDQKFDAGYVSGDQDADDRYFSSFLHAITAVPKYRFEPIPGDALPAAAAAVLFVGIKDGAPRFQLQIDNARMADITPCEMTGPGACLAFGVRMRFAPADQGAVTLTFDGAAPRRSLNVINEYDPLKP